jgi:hypothetical protein
MITNKKMTGLMAAALLLAGTSLGVAQSSGGGSAGGGTSGGASGLSGGAGGGAGGGTVVPRAATTSQPSNVNPSSQNAPGALSSGSSGVGGSAVSGTSATPGAGSNTPAGPGSTAGQQVPIHGTQQDSGLSGQIEQSNRNSANTACGGGGTSTSGATSTGCASGDALGTPSIISGSGGSRGAVDVSRP